VSPERLRVRPRPAATEPAGRPLDTATRGGMERRLGHDFSQVRIHADAKGAAVAAAHGAEALAVGEELTFAAGRFAPGTRTGDELLAHELVHVVQQRAGAAGSPHGTAAGAEAEAQAAALGRAIVSRVARPRAVHRQPKPAAGISKTDLAAKLKALLGHDVTITVGDEARQTKELGGPAAKRKLPDKWEKWDPGANATLFDEIVTAFGDVGREVGGLPDITEIVFYKRHYGWDAQDNVVVDPHAAASINGRVMNIYETALFPSSIIAGGSGIKSSGVFFAKERSTKKAEAPSEGASRAESQRRSVAHELGHGIERRTGALSDFEQAVGWVRVGGDLRLYDIQAAGVKKAIEKSTEPPASARITKADWNSGKHREQPMREYAVTDSQEDFADSLSAWIYARDALKLRSPARWKFFEDHKGAASTWAAKLVPPGGTPAAPPAAAPVKKGGG